MNLVSCHRRSNEACTSKPLAALLAASLACCMSFSAAHAAAKEKDPTIIPRVWSGATVSLVCSEMVSDTSYVVEMIPPEDGHEMGTVRIRLQSGNSPCSSPLMLFGGPR